MVPHSFRRRLQSITITGRRSIRREFFLQRISHKNPIVSQSTSIQLTNSAYIRWQWAPVFSVIKATLRTGWPPRADGNVPKASFCIESMSADGKLWPVVCMNASHMHGFRSYLLRQYSYASPTGRSRSCTAIQYVWSAPEDNLTRFREANNKQTFRTFLDLSEAILFIRFYSALLFYSCLCHINQSVFTAIVHQIL